LLLHFFARGGIRSNDFHGVFRSGDSVPVSITLIIIGALVCWVAVYLRNNWEKIKKYEAKSKLPEIDLPKIKFKDSGWVLVYVICGWISCVCSLIIVLIGAFGGSFKSSVISALPILFAGLGSLLAAHILRLLEKGVHHLESIDENKKPPN